jgi:hypothetical protein
LLALANFIPLVILDERNVVKHGRGWTFQVAFQMRDSHIGEMLTIRLLVLDILALVVDDPIIARGMNVDSVDSVAANVDVESHHAPGGFGGGHTLRVHKPLHLIALLHDPNPRRGFVLIDVLIEVVDDLDRMSPLDINMTFK